MDGSRQLGLFVPDSVSEALARREARILTWNVANPSLSRAKQQYEWLLATNANVLVLTEIKQSEGGRYLRDGLLDAGFTVVWQEPASGYSVLLAEKGFDGQALPLGQRFLPERIAGLRLTTPVGEFVVIGMYVPSRGPAERRNVDKGEFQEHVLALLETVTSHHANRLLVVGGDLNVVPRNHEPAYSVFGEWEYQFYDGLGRMGLRDAFSSLHPGVNEHSWFGRRGDGYRFDYLFVSPPLEEGLARCCYLHEPRTTGLSDHSALLMSIELAHIAGPGDA